MRKAIGSKLATCKTRTAISRLSCVFLILGMAEGCEREPSSQASSRPAAQRIISISPNSTEIIAALGAADRLVAVSDFCVWPESITKLPHIGGLFDTNLEALLTLRPDLIVLRGQQKAVEDLCATNGIILFRDTTESLDDIYETLHQLGELLDRKEQAAAVEKRMRQRLMQITTAVADRPRPRILMTIARNTDGLTSVMSAAAGTFVDDMIVAAGGENVFSKSALSYPTISPEAILMSNADVIVEAMPEVKLSPELEMKLLAQWREFGALPAVKNNRVHVVTDDNVTIPSPRIADVIAKLARLFHPGVEIE